LAQLLGVSYYTHSCCNNLGYNYVVIGEYDKAVRYYQRAMAVV